MLTDTQKHEQNKKKRILTAQKIYRHIMGLLKAVLQHWTDADVDFLRYGTSSKRVDKR